MARRGKVLLTIVILGLLALGIWNWMPGTFGRAPGTGGDRATGEPRPDGPEAQTVQVRIRAGGEKIGFLRNPEVAVILRERFRIEVVADKAGSVEMVRDLPVQGFDALWPANSFCRELLEERAAREGFEVLRTEDVFNSPLVVLSWPDPVRVFSGPSWNVVQRRNDRYHSVDVAKLLALVEKETKWTDPAVGLPYHGKVVVRSTDPVKSSSGNLFAGLLANVMNGGDPAAGASVEPLLPRLVTLFARMGLKEESSGTFFEHFLGQGVGAYPFGVAYENQLVEFALERPESGDVIRRDVVVLYPEPTVWATHPLSALTPAGKQLVDALRDPEVQDLAWRRHGFRSGVGRTANDPSEFRIRGIPDQIVSAMPLPDRAAMSRILEALSTR